jgi:hypothetical protein
MLPDMILSWRQYLSCVAAGIVLGVSLILTHTAPGLANADDPNTPRHRDTIRQTDIDLLASALNQYQKDHGRLPITLPTADTQICTSTGVNCESQHYVDLSFLLTGGNYLDAIPVDPGRRKLWASGYTIAQLPGNKIRLVAPKSERSSIENTR